MSGFMDFDPLLPRKIRDSLSGLNLCIFEADWRSEIDKVIDSIAAAKAGTGEVDDLSALVETLKRWEEVANA